MDRKIPDTMDICDECGDMLPKEDVYMGLCAICWEEIMEDPEDVMKERSWDDSEDS